MTNCLPHGRGGGGGGGEGFDSGLPSSNVRGRARATEGEENELNRRHDWCFQNVSDQL